MSISWPICARPLPTASPRTSENLSVSAFLPAQLPILPPVKITKASQYLGHSDQPKGAIKLEVSVPTNLFPVDLHIPFQNLKATLKYLRPTVQVRLTILPRPINRKNMEIFP